MKRLLILIALATLATGCSMIPRRDLEALVRRQYERWRDNAAEKPSEPPQQGLGLPEGTKWVHASRDVTPWPESFVLHGVTIHPAADGIRHHVDLHYSGLQDIPAWNVPGDPNNIHNVNGQAWVAREWRGQWYFGTFEYLRVGQVRKEMASSPNWMLEPVSGDRIGFMVSTLARHPKENGTVAGGITYQGRSAIFWTRWP